MKKIMILGAGVYQVPLIKSAKERGLYVIVASIAGNYPGFALADKVYYENTTDFEKILEISQEEKIDAIATTGTDVAMITVGYVCENLGLPGLSLEAAKKATNKAYMKQAFYEHNVSTAKYIKVCSVDEAIAAAEKIGYPVVVKIVDKSGSRGITKVADSTSLIEAYEHAQELTDLPYVLIEEFIQAKEIGVDAFVQNGEIKLIMPHDKLVYEGKRTGIPMGHICPMNMTDALERNIRLEVSKAIRALELDNCAVNVDAFITPDDNVYIIEAAGRCGATGIPEVLSGYLGVNYYQAIIDNALGIDVLINEKSQGSPTASFLLHSDVSGVVDSIKYELDGVKYSNRNYFVPGKVSIQLDVGPGEMVETFSNGTKRIGQAIFIEESMEKLVTTMNGFENSFSVTVKS